MTPGVVLLAGDDAERLDRALGAVRDEDSNGSDELLEDELALVSRFASLGEDRAQSVFPLEAAFAGS